MLVDARDNRIDCGRGETVSRFAGSCAALRHSGSGVSSAMEGGGVLAATCAPRCGRALQLTSDSTRRAVMESRHLLRDVARCRRSLSSVLQAALNLGYPSLNDVQPLGAVWRAALDDQKTCPRVTHRNEARLAPLDTTRYRTTLAWFARCEAALGRRRDRHHPAGHYDRRAHARSVPIEAVRPPSDGHTPFRATLWRGST